MRLFLSALSLLTVVTAKEVHKRGNSGVSLGYKDSNTGITQLNGYGLPLNYRSSYYLNNVKGDFVSADLTKYSSNHQPYNDRQLSGYNYNTPSQTNKQSLKVSTEKGIATKDQSSEHASSTDHELLSSATATQKSAEKEKLTATSVTDAAKTGATELYGKLDDSSLQNIKFDVSTIKVPTVAPHVQHHEQSMQNFVVNAVSAGNSHFATSQYNNVELGNSLNGQLSASHLSNSLGPVYGPSSVTHIDAKQLGFMDDGRFDASVFDSATTSNQRSSYAQNYLPQQQQQQANNYNRQPHSLISGPIFDYSTLKGSNKDAGYGWNTNNPNYVSTNPWPENKPVGDSVSSESTHNNVYNDNIQPWPRFNGGASPPWPTYPASNANIESCPQQNNGYASGWSLNTQNAANVGKSQAWPQTYAWSPNAPNSGLNGNLAFWPQVNKPSAWPANTQNLAPGANIQFWPQSNDNIQTAAWTVNQQKPQFSGGAQAWPQINKVPIAAWPVQSAALPNRIDFWSQHNNNLTPLWQEHPQNAGINGKVEGQANNVGTLYPQGNNLLSPHWSQQTQHAGLRQGKSFDVSAWPQPKQIDLTSYGNNQNSRENAFGGNPPANAAVWHGNVQNSIAGGKIYANSALNNKLTSWPQTGNGYAQTFHGQIDASALKGVYAPGWMGNNRNSLFNGKFRGQSTIGSYDGGIKEVHAPNLTQYESKAPITDDATPPTIPSATQPILSLGSGSLGITRLQDGNFALGSGSLGYSAPPPPIIKGIPLGTLPPSNLPITKP